MYFKDIARGTGYDVRRKGESMITARVLTEATGGMETPFAEVQEGEEEQLLAPQKDHVVE